MHKINQDKAQLPPARHSSKPWQLDAECGSRERAPLAAQNVR